MNTTKQPAANRPLSPFMIGPYYRPQLTSMLSITHRLTGIALTVGTLFLTGWLIALASGPAAFSAYAEHLGAWYGQAILFAFGWAMLYHLCNGLRHLGWDLGYGLDIKTAYRTGYAVLVVSLLLTIVVWVVASFA